MHGVKRLFSWMIPRFDRERFRVSLVSLRRRDLSEETLDALGIDLRYLSRSKFDPFTLPALLKIVDEQQIDILHLHGYGATTFGRLVGAWRGIPTIVHEHANLTSTPWFQKVADRALEPYTDIAIAVSQSTADFVIHARLIPASKVKVVYLGRAPRRVQPAAIAGRAPRRPGRSGRRARRVRHRHDHAAARVEGQFVSRGGGRARRPRAAVGPLLSRRRGAAPRRTAAAGGGPRPRGPVRVLGLPARRAGHARGLRSQRVPVPLGRHAAHGLRGPRDGEADCRDRRRRPARHPHARSRRGHRPASGTRRRSPSGSCGPSTGPRSAPASAPTRGRRGGSTTSTSSCAGWSGFTGCSTRNPGRRDGA